MAEGNSTVRSNTKKKNADRISSLPESALHHILSFLDMKEVVQTSLISRRWQYVWISVPNLNFCSSNWWDTEDEGYGPKEVFLNFVDKVLFFRDGSDICKFHASCSFCCDADRINAWMTVAVRRHVQEININIVPNQSYILPHFIFTSAMVIFKLKSRFRHSKATIQLPNSICFAPRLKILQLVLVKLSNGNSNGELVLSCPVLEDLTIEDCDHENLSILNISTPQLRNLVIQLRSSCSCKIKICTPNLTSLLLRDYLYEDYSLENLSSLVSAKIELQTSRTVDVVPLIEILKGIHNATNLELSGCYLQSSLQPQDIFNQLPNSFINLRCLKLIGRGDICVISHLLKSSTCMETLVLDASQVPKVEDCVEELFHSMLHCLKSVEIQNTEGCEIELQFLEFLLKNAVILESLTITTNKMMWKRRKSELIRFSKKIRSLSKTSSNLTILVLLGT